MGLDWIGWWGEKNADGLYGGGEWRGVCCVFIGCIHLGGEVLGGDMRMKWVWAESGSGR